MQRRELFNSFFNKKQEPKVIRPPYGGSDFISKCIECSGVCADVCEENIIVILEDKTPHLDFSKSGCTFCDECAIACEFDVLRVESIKKIDTIVSIDMLKCLSWHKTMCFSCKDPCSENAIDFLGMFRPTINNDKCTSCGLCIHSCPVSAIKVN